MKKKFAVAAAITAGLCFAGSGHLKPAFAGYWEEVPNPYLDMYGNAPYPGDPDYSVWQSEAAKRTNGTGTISETFLGQPSSTSANWQDDATYSGFFPNSLVEETDQGTSGSITSVGKIRILFHWVRNQINGEDDPNDNPPATLNIVALLSADAAQDTSPIRRRPF